MDPDVTRREVAIDTPVCLRQTGGPEVLQIELKTERSPGTGQAWVEQEVIGVDYLAVMRRDGAVRLSSPSGLVPAGAGYMLARRPDIIEVSVGDRIGDFLRPLGNCASGRLFPRAVLAALNAGIIKPDVWENFSLAKAQVAHAALEGGSSAGAIPLRP